MTNILAWPLDENRIRSLSDGMACKWGGTYGWVRSQLPGNGSVSLDPGKKYCHTESTNSVSLAKRKAHRAEIGQGNPMTPPPPRQSALELGHEHNWPHQGWDLVASPGTRIYASADGQVKLAGTHGTSTTGYGKWLLVQYGPWFVFYAHLSNNTVVAQDAHVVLGQHIATTGITGNATATYPHLHLELRDNGVIGIPPSEIPANPFSMRKDPSEVFGAPPFSIVPRAPLAQTESEPPSP